MKTSRIRPRSNAPGRPRSDAASMSTVRARFRRHPPLTSFQKRVAAFGEIGSVSPSRPRGAARCSQPLRCRSSRPRSRRHRSSRESGSTHCCLPGARQPTPHGYSPDSPTTISFQRCLSLRSRCRAGCRGRAPQPWARVLARPRVNQIGTRKPDGKLESARGLDATTGDERTARRRPNRGGSTIENANREGRSRQPHSVSGANAAREAAGRAG